MSGAFCIIAARNEEGYLPGFLSHIAPYVEGIVALDDGSTDRTPDLFRRCPKVCSLLTSLPPEFPHQNESANRTRMLREAHRLGARWIICGDADERFEQAFLERVSLHMQHGDETGGTVRMFNLVNLWNSHLTYRLDGRCGPRWAPRMFKLPESFTPRAEARMHQPWYPPELDRAPRVKMNAYIYHLRMIAAADRNTRWQKFKSVDPRSEHQPIGYDHMVEERGLTLKRIVPGRGYRLF